MQLKLVLQDLLEEITSFHKDLLDEISLFSKKAPHKRAPAELWRI